MSKIARLEVKNFLGIEQLDLNPSKITYISGKNKQGKSSILDSIEKALSNNSKRPKVIRGEENEATIYIELDDGTSIDRRLRDNKSDYVKVRNNDNVVATPETYLKELFNPESFDPTDFLLKNEKEQAEMILELIDIKVTKEDAKAWFKEIPEVDYDKHGLKILKAIEKYYYNKRKDINAYIKSLESEIKSLEKQLPDNYDAEEWRDIKLSDLYENIEKANRYNEKIEEAQETLQSEEDDLQNIRNKYEYEWNKHYQEVQEEIKNNEKAINNAKESIAANNEQIQELESNESERIRKLDDQLKEEIEKLHKKYEQWKQTLKDNTSEEIENLKMGIMEKRELISAKESLIEDIHDRTAERKQEIQKKISEEQQERKYQTIEAKPLAEEPLAETTHMAKEAENVEAMKGYIPLWDRIQSIREGALLNAKHDKDFYNRNILTAREKPVELLKEAEKPIEGLGLDDKMNITINGLPVGNLSTSEQLDFAIRIAQSRCKDLKLINVDRFESLDKESQEAFFEKIKDDEYQYFITAVGDGELKIERRD